MVVAGWVSRHAGRSGALWGLIFGLFIIVQTRAYTSTYKTQASHDQLAHAYGSDVAMNALIGSERGINTVVGWVDWRFAGILGVLGCIWGLLTSTRLFRGEEEVGHYDLLLAGQTTPSTRRGPSASRPRSRPAGIIRVDGSRGDRHRPISVGRVQFRRRASCFQSRSYRVRPCSLPSALWPANWPAPVGAPRPWPGSSSASRTPSAWWPTRTRACIGWCGRARSGGSRNRGR